MRVLYVASIAHLFTQAFVKARAYTTRNKVKNSDDKDGTSKQ
jgi:hypothetical protein